MGSMKKLYCAAEEKVIFGEKLGIIDLPISPCTFGLFSPKILFPKNLMGELEDEELKTVIMKKPTYGLVIYGYFLSGNCYHHSTG